MVYFKYHTKCIIFGREHNLGIVYLSFLCGKLCKKIGVVTNLGDTMRCVSEIRKHTFLFYNEVRGCTFACIATQNFKVTTAPNAALPGRRKRPARIAASPFSKA